MPMDEGQKAKPHDSLQPNESWGLTNDLLEFFVLNDWCPQLDFLDVSVSPGNPTTEGPSCMNIFATQIVDRFYAAVNALSFQGTEGLCALVTLIEGVGQKRSDRQHKFPSNLIEPSAYPVGDLIAPVHVAGNPLKIAEHFGIQQFTIFVFPVIGEDLSTRNEMQKRRFWIFL